MTGTTREKERKLRREETKGKREREKGTMRLVSYL